MLKYRLDNISADPNGGNVAYVQLYDDASPETTLASFCVPYIDQQQFEAALEARTQKYLSARAAQDATAAAARASFAAVEGKINSEVSK